MARPLSVVRHGSAKTPVYTWSALSVARIKPGPRTLNCRGTAADGTGVPRESTTVARTNATWSNPVPSASFSACKTTAAGSPAVVSAVFVLSASPQRASKVPGANGTSHVRGAASAGIGSVPSGVPFSESATCAQLLYTSTRSGCGPRLSGVQSANTTGRGRYCSDSYPGSVGALGGVATRRTMYSTGCDAHHASCSRASGFGKSVRSNRPLASPIRGQCRLSPRQSVRDQTNNPE